MAGKTGGYASNCLYYFFDCEVFCARLVIAILYIYVHKSDSKPAGSEGKWIITYIPSG